MDALKLYVTTGNFEKVQTIVNKGDLKFDTNWIDYDLLKTALIYKQKDIAKFFIQNKFRLNTNIYSETDNTPLHLAVILGWKDIVQLLLRYGASTDVPENIHSITPIELSFLTEKYELTDLMLPFYKNCSLDLVDSLNRDTKHELHENLISIIHIAAARNHVGILRECIKIRKQINCSIRSDYFNWPRYTPLHFAVKFGSKETIKFLLKSGADFTAQDAHGSTPLHLAAIIQDDSSINLMLSHHKYVGKNPKNSNGLSHLHIACTRNDPKIVHGLIQCGANPNDQVSDSSLIFKKFTALHCAVVYQCLDVVRLLLALGSDKNINLDQLLLDVHKTKNPALINLIFNSKYVTSPYVEFGKSISPLHKACMQLENEKMKALIESGASINSRLPPAAPIYAGGTVLHIAVSYRRMSTIQWLLENGADITIADIRGKTPLHLAFDSHYFEGTKVLLNHLSKWEDNPEDEDGLSHFHIACAFSQDSNIIESFLKAGEADVNATVSNDSSLYSGYTPLHMAISYSNFSTVIRLLDHGADVTIKDNHGFTAFDDLFELGDEVVFMNCQSDFLKNIAAHKESLACFRRRGFTLLHIACILHDMSMALRSIVDCDVNGEIDADSRIYPGCRPLHLAATSGDSEMSTFLLDRGADNAAPDLVGNTPLYLWRWNVALDKQKRIFDDRLFSIDKNPIGLKGFSHFHIACDMKKVNIVKTFLRHGTDVDSHIHMAGTVLHRAAANGDLELAQLLLDEGADVDARDIINQTPLHVCTEDIMMTSLLVDNGADVNAEKYNGLTPLQCNARNWGANIAAYYALVQHVLRLRAAGFYVSDDNLAMCTEDQQQEYGYLEILTVYKKACIEELESMVYVHIDENTTLRDVLHKTTYQMESLVETEIFQHMVNNSEPFKHKYPIYWYLIMLQYKNVLKRRSLIKKVLLLMKRYTLVNLTPVCYEEILRHFDVKELAKLVKTIGQG